MEDLIAVMDAVGLQRATLFATADGALVALRFAARCPERVQALVILDGTAKWVACEGYEAGVPVDWLHRPRCGTRPGAARPIRWRSR